MSSITSQPNHPSSCYTPIDNSYRKTSTSTSTTSSSTSSSACASCKYQRRKCTNDCVLAPYFPAEKQQQFLNAHRLFGVSKILKIIDKVEPEQRQDAMRSIIFQSNARAQDPVGGCYRIILDLQHHIDVALAELQYVKHQIDIFRAQVDSASTMAPDVHLNPLLMSSDAVGQTEQLYTLQQQQQQQLQCFSYLYYDHNSHLEGIPPEHDVSGIGAFDVNVGNVVASEEFGMQLPAPEMLGGIEQKENVKPLVSIFDIQQAYMINDDGESKDITATSTITSAIHSSSNHEPRDDEGPLEQVEEHDLKSAASLFTLTNCIPSGG
ncbi:hypothetical protein HPP92_004877 [Vanilla planifolia]|uniref:LOB domain-containing protein n=1 Tax=Vanilla planifolia TaxID=51239 RepID=A0A835VE25_VANPL|nr:hypothetical protein HPP92_004877 [Vanilla planifolia]